MKSALTAILALFSGYCLLYRLTTVPAIWYDEGYFLLTAKTLATEGRYAIGLAQEYRGAHLSVGPVVLFPLAAAMKLFGANLLTARLVSVLWGAALFLFCFLFLLKKHSFAAAVIGLLCILLNPLDGYLGFIRTCAGEVPAAVFALAALALWGYWIKNPAPRASLMLGLLAGAAASAKPQALLITAAFGAAVLLHCKKQGWAQAMRQALWFSAGALSVYCICLFLIIAPVGIEAYRAQLLFLLEPAKQLALQSGSGILAKFGALAPLRLALFICIVASLPLTSFLLTKRNKRELCAELLPLWIIIFVWEIWFFFFSIGWGKYALIGHIFAALNLGILGSELLQRAGSLVRLCSSVVLALLALWGARFVVELIQTSPDDVSAFKMAEYISKNLKPGTPIQTYEWELAFLLPWKVQAPPLAVHYTLLREKLAEIPPEKRSIYQFWNSGAEYIVVGEFGKDHFRAYPPQELSRHCELVYGVGRYGLCRLIPRHES